jgi:sulfur-oxidizing protein SoxB
MKDAARGRRPDRNAALPPRQLQRHARRRDLRRALAERDAEIALSPGFRWGNSLLPGQDITREDIYNATALTYPAAYRMTMTGARLKEILEDVADNLFNPDPYYQQGGDMVRVGGLSYTSMWPERGPPHLAISRRCKTGQPLDAEQGLCRRRLGQRERRHRRPADQGRGDAHIANQVVVRASCTCAGGGC